MKAKEFLDVSGTILLFIGFFLAFLPHVFHARIGLSKQTHLKHITTGIVLVLIALGIFGIQQQSLEKFV